MRALHMICAIMIIGVLGIPMVAQAQELDDQFPHFSISERRGVPTECAGTMFDGGDCKAEAALSALAAAEALSAYNSMVKRTIACGTSMSVLRCVMAVGSAVMYYFAADDVIQAGLKYEACLKEQ